MDKRLSRDYFNSEAEHWDENVRNNDPIKLRAMANQLEIKPDDWILDVGTGTGVFIPYLAEKLNGAGKIFCADFAINMLLKALLKNSKDIDYICTDIENPGIEERCFDVIVCYSTFPHFHDKPAALRYLSLFLKPGGSIYICHTTSRNTINGIHKNIPELQDHLIPGNIEMAQLLSVNGFSDISIQEDNSSYLAAAKAF